MARYRSWLFVPANRPDRVVKAFASGADAVIIDLEDACPVAEKVASRALVAEAIANHSGAHAFVRINAATTPLALADLAAVIVPGLSGIVLPKAETLGMLHAIDWAIGQFETERGLATGTVELMPLVESALGLVDLAAIARSGLSRIRRLTFGAGDLTLDLGARWTTDEAELFPLRSALVAVSRAAGLAPPIDTPWPAIHDQAGYDRCLERVRDLGFGGKMLIHPSHVEAANRTFMPSAEAVDYARRVIAAAAEAEASGSGAFQLDGRLIDQVNIVQARRVLDAHEASR
ncbi:HpcH/HpaI aldolase/citrate lyase family protein [Sphingobium subterraneum]|uniref:Citrate lyase subunit beta/citryl-CoA lyase n=1 Tax=Sphingobium subterraneum TaxID=627688 RepID=A0A841IWS2_9SPHN|nr:CoA ester lyase [Sphingobium subterraneum]MBB6123389.1 citrate lyase subunit beta/citryl-CoA lyase [Sphingobium subterraneum]